MNASEKKKKNKERLLEIADRVGDLYLIEMLWDMFDDLPLKKQERYIKRAEEIAKEKQ